MIPVYRYKATLIRVIDGDTFVLRIDLGFDPIFVQKKIRVHDYWAPELRAPGGLEDKEKAEKLLTDAKQIVVQTYKDQQSFERWIADVWLDGVPFPECMTK